MTTEDAVRLVKERLTMRGINPLTFPLYEQFAGSLAMRVEAMASASIPKDSSLPQEAVNPLLASWAAYVDYEALLVVAARSMNDKLKN